MRFAGAKCVVTLAFLGTATGLADQTEALRSPGVATPLTARLRQPAESHDATTGNSNLTKNRRVPAPGTLPARIEELFLVD